MNKYAKIAVGILVGLILVAGVYFLVTYFLSTPSAPTTTGDSTPINNQVVATQTNPLTNLTSEGVMDFWINKSTQDAYYVDLSGRIFKTTPDKNGQVISSQIIPSLSRVQPSFDGQSALFSISDSTNPSFSVYQLNKKAFSPLPAGTVSASFDPKSNTRLVLLGGPATGNQLTLLDLATKKSINLIKINQIGLDLDWITADIILLKEHPSNQTKNTIWSYNLKTKAIQKFLGEGSALSLKWIPEMGRGLLSADSDLSVIDQGGQPQYANLRITSLPDKCGANNQGIVCAAPANLSNKKTFFDDYTKGSRVGPDNIYSFLFLDIAKGGNLPFIKTFGPALERPDLEISKMKLSNTQALFINKLDGKLYSLSL